MLHVYYMNQAALLVLDDVVWVGELQESICNETGVRKDEQVLLVSGGDVLDAEKKLTAYGAGTDTNPFYLFSMTHASLTASTSTFSHGVGMGNDLRDINDELEPVIQRVIRGPFTREGCTTLVQVAQEVSEESRKVVNKCGRLVDDHRHLQQGWFVVMANMDDNAKVFKRRRQKFTKHEANYNRDREERLKLLSTFAADLAVLKLLQVGPLGCEQRTLFDWIQASEPNFDLSGLAEELEVLCREMETDWLKRLNVSWAELQDSLIKVAEYRDIRGLSKRLDQLDEGLRVAEELSSQQDALANKLRSSGIPVQQQDLALAQEQFTSIIQEDMIRSKYRQLYETCQKFGAAKLELLQMIRQRLLYLASCQQRVYDLDNELVLCEEKLRRVKHYLQLMRQIHDAPKVLAHIVLESARRTTFSAPYDSTVGELAEQTQRLGDVERALRRTFGDKVQRHFLSRLLAQVTPSARSSVSGPPGPPQGAPTHHHMVGPPEQRGGPTPPLVVTSPRGHATPPTMMSSPGLAGTPQGGCGGGKLASSGDSSVAGFQDPEPIAVPMLQPADIDLMLRTCPQLCDCVKGLVKELGTRDEAIGQAKERLIDLASDLPSLQACLQSILNQPRPDQSSPARGLSASVAIVQRSPVKGFTRGGNLGGSFRASGTPDSLLDLDLSPLEGIGGSPDLVHVNIDKSSDLPSITSGDRGSRPGSSGHSNQAAVGGGDIFASCLTDHGPVVSGSAGICVGRGGDSGSRRSDSSSGPATLTAVPIKVDAGVQTEKADREKLGKLRAEVENLKKEQQALGSSLGTAMAECTGHLDLTREAIQRTVQPFFAKPNVNDASATASPVTAEMTSSMTSSIFEKADAETQTEPEPAKVDAECHSVEIPQRETSDAVTETQFVDETREECDRVKTELERSRSKVSKLEADLETVLQRLKEAELTLAAVQSAKPPDSTSVSPTSGNASPDTLPPAGEPASPRAEGSSCLSALERERTPHAPHQMEESVARLGLLEESVCVATAAHDDVTLNSRLGLDVSFSGHAGGDAQQSRDTTNAPSHDTRDADVTLNSTLLDGVTGQQSCDDVTLNSRADGAITPAQEEPETSRDLECILEDLVHEVVKRDLNEFRNLNSPEISNLEEISTNLVAENDEETTDRTTTVATRGVQTANGETKLHVICTSCARREKSYMVSLLNLKENDFVLGQPIPRGEVKEKEGRRSPHECGYAAFNLYATARYFIQPDSWKVDKDLTGSRILLAKVNRREYCLAKKEPNRFRVPKGSKFYLLFVEVLAYLDL